MRLLTLVFLMSTLGMARSEESSKFVETIQWSESSRAHAREELKSTREKIALEQKPKLLQLSELQSEISELRRENTEIDYENNGLKHEIDRLSVNNETLQSHAQSIHHRLLHARREFEKKVHSIEKPQYSSQFLALEKIDTSTIDGRIQRFEKLFEIATTAIDRIDQQIGGHTYAAQAISNGTVTNGNALQLGPYVFFQTNDQRFGFILKDGNKIPILRESTPKYQTAIMDAMEGKNAFLPFDPLLDQAFLNEDAKTNLWEHLKSGGIWIVPILTFGFLSTLIAVIKLVQIRSVKAPMPEEILALIETTSKNEFTKGLKNISELARSTFQEGFNYRNKPEKIRSAAMRQELIKFRDTLESNLSLLALTAAVAPLLGLLGTVTGMIKTFQIISIHGAGDARTLSGGISEALVTTELGLVVAIPALLAHAWLHRRTKRISQQTSALADRFNKSLPDNAS